VATFTITADTNIDAISGKTSADQYVINGATVTFDQHTRYGVEANTSATLGIVTVSGTLGGNFVVDGRYVRLIAYDTGSGNVPNYNTTISQGSASGLLIGVYDDLASAPITPGVGMPTDGFILIKQWNSVAYTTGALTGIGANATAADRVGWLEIVGNEASGSSGVITFNGLGNQGVPQFRGAKFEIGTTPGSPARTDTYQIPTNGNTCFMPGVWVEKSSGSEDYEFYATTTSTALLANVNTDIRRGKYCWVSSAGVLRFGHDGTNSTGGFVPPANCKIVTGNIFLNMAPTASPTVNSLNAATTSRYRIGGTSLPEFNADWITCNWYVGPSNYGLITVTNSSIMGPVFFSQSGQKMTWTKVGVGAQVAATATAMVELSQCAYGADITDCYISYGVFGASARSVFRSNLSNNVTLLRCEFGFTGTRTATSNYAVILASNNDLDIQDCVMGGTLELAIGRDAIITGDNEFWFDHAPYVTTATNITYCIALSNTTNVLVEDITFPIAGQLPRGGLCTLASGVNNVFRNIGTLSSPIDLRMYSENGASWSRVTTTATVTTASPHGLANGDRIFVIRCDNVGAIAINPKDITVTGANTFTFVCTNTGTTSGLLDFYSSCHGANVMINVGATNTEATKIQNVHFKGNTTQGASLHATVIDTEFKNVSWDQDYSFHFTNQGTGTILRSIQIGARGASAVATLGTHWEDIFTRAEGDVSATGVSWTRSAAVITVTQVDHGLAANESVQIYGSSNPAGATNNLVAITFLTKDTFSYSGSASGATSGTLNYRVSEGSMMLFCNAPSATTGSQAVITSGTPQFTGQSQLVMFTVGDQIYFETPDYILGHDQFEVMWPVVGSSGGSPRNSVDIEYQINRGSGWSAWKNMHVKRTSGAGTSGASTITVNDTTGIAVDDYVWNNALEVGLGAETKVVSIDSGTQLTVSVANASTFSGATLSFGAHPNEAAFPSTGIKLRVRMTTITAFTNAMTSIVVYTKTTSTSRARLYSQLTDYTLTLTGLVTGSDIVILEAGTTTAIENIDANAGTTYAFVHSSALTGDDVDICVYKAGYVPYIVRTYELESADTSLPITQVVDRSYDT
jgi:hypothetical protein